MIEIEFIIIVIASKGNIYDKIVKVYWNPFIEYCNKNFKNIKIYLLYGDSYDKNLNVNPNNLLEYNIKENVIPGVLIKTIKAFKYINENYNYKYVLRTNISSFLVLENIFKKSSEFANYHFLYAGVVINSGRKYFSFNFASGALFWTNKKTIDFIISNEKLLNYKYYDDLAIGLIIHRHSNIKLIPQPRYDNFMNLPDYKLIPDKIKESKIYNHYHFRLKSKNREKDIHTFEILTKHFYSCLKAE